MKYSPPIGSDVLLHAKDTDTTERVTFPITRYDNIIGSPEVVKAGNVAYGSPFHLLETGEEEVTIAEIRALCGSII